MWELAGKLSNDNMGKYSCKDLYVAQSELAPFCSKKLSIENTE